MKTLPQRVLSSNACYRNVQDNYKCLSGINPAIANPPEKTEMELTKALPSGSSQPGGGEEVGRPQIQSYCWGLRILGMEAQGLREHSRGAFGPDRRVERARKTSWRRRQISSGLRTSGID